MENKIKGSYDDEGNYIMPLIKKYYSIWDRTGKCYMGVWPADTDMRAIRFIENSMEQQGSEIKKHPEDYRLDFVFEMDMRKGEVTNNNIRTILECKEYGN